MTPIARQRRPIPELLTRVGLATGVGYAAAAYSISRWLTRPSPRKPETLPKDFGLPFEVVRCKTADGFRLTGWVIEPPEPRATVALFHGMRGSRERMLDRIPYLYPAGYRCVLFDLRAHGESSGKRTSFGYYERRDVEAVAGFIEKRWAHQPRAAIGTSMGAAALCYAARHAVFWNAVILESCYQDIRLAFTSRLQHGFPPWYQRLSRGVIWITERRLGLRLFQLAPLERINDFGHTPIFIVTGGADVHATVSEAHELFNRCRGPRRIWVVPDAGHRDIVEKAGESYGERVLNYLNEYLAA
jgi:alpha-beta hydrolase superfamily lysophospholipase